MSAARDNKGLLRCGALGAPLFVLVFLIEGITRPHYNALRQPVSDLAIGELGLIQTANFIITGLLFLAFAIGLRRTLRPLGGVWGPWVVGSFAIGLIGAGIFTGDKYPLLHNLCGIPVFFGLPIACFIFSRLFVRLGRHGWAAYSVISGVTMLVMFIFAGMGFGGRPGLVNFAGVFQRLSITVGWTWVTLLAVYSLRSSYGSDDVRLRSQAAQR